MRPIEFRGWDKLKGGMFYNIELKGFFPALKDVFDLPYIWMLYTGLKDKNNKKIFEGDIIKETDVKYYDNTIHPCIVEWDSEFAGFEPFIAMYADHGPQVFPDKCEVIGNIYENPELLDDGSIKK